MTRRSKPDGDCCWPVGAGEGHDPGTDTVLDASRRDHTGGAPMWVRLMEGLGVVFTDAKHCHRAR
jgi:hypothetical protein